MKFLCSLVFASAFLSVVGCHSDTKYDAVTTVTPVSSLARAPAPGTTGERQEVIQRFTQDIWPAVVAYNQEGPSEGGPGYKQYLTVIDKDIDTSSWGRLRDAVQHLGNVSPIDEPQVGGARADTLHLADTVVTALNSPTAALQACYTYTAVSYPSDIAHPQYAPAASEANFELHKTDNWYLRAITNDHVVPNCSAAKA